MTYTVPPLILRAVQAALAVVAFVGLFGGTAEDISARPGQGDVVALADRMTESERWTVVGTTEDGGFWLSRVDDSLGTLIRVDPENLEIVP